MELREATQAAVAYVQDHKGDPLADALRVILSELKAQGLREREVVAALGRIEGHLEKVIGGAS